MNTGPIVAIAGRALYDGRVDVGMALGQMSGG